MAEPTSIISVVAAVVSAIGGAAASIAAFRSTKHAREAFDENRNAEKRFSLRQLSLTAHSVSVEVERILWLSQGLKTSYRSLAVSSGAVGGSREQLFQKEIDANIDAAKKLSAKADPFISLQTQLLNGPLEEISSRELEMAQCLSETIALRLKIEMALSEIQAQNATHRQGP